MSGNLQAIDWFELRMTGTKCVRIEKNGVSVV